MLSKIKVCVNRGGMGELPEMYAVLKQYAKNKGWHLALMLSNVFAYYIDNVIKKEVKGK